MGIFRVIILPEEYSLSHPTANPKLMGAVSLYDKRTENVICQTK